MRFNSLLDSVYALSTLWGSPLGPQVCAASPILPSASYEAAWGLAMGTPAAATAFIDVNVVPMDRERVIPNQTVVVEGGRITAVGPVSQVKVPAGAVRVEGRGKYLMPGLGEMHYGPYHSAPGPGENSPQSFADRLFIWYMASGVTTIRGALGTKYDLQQLRRSFAEFPMPRLYPAGGIHRRTRPDSVAAYVAAAKAAGYKHLGTGESVTADTPERRAFFDSLVAAARRVELPVSTHSHELAFEATLALGTTGGAGEHLYAFWEPLFGWVVPGTKENPAAKPMELPVAKAAALASTAKRAGVWFVPTLDCMEKVRTPHRAGPPLVKMLQDSGVKLLLGSDGPAMSSNGVHDELAALVRAGLTPYQALMTGTRHVAEYFRLLDSSGTVAVGKWADLVLLDGNPLADVGHARQPAGVMIAGRWFDRAALDPSQRPSVQALSRVKATFLALADSLAATKPAERGVYERLLRRLAAELKTLRTTTLTPSGFDGAVDDREVRARLQAQDPRVRKWLNKQAYKDEPLPLPDLTQPAP